MRSNGSDRRFTVADTADGIACCGASNRVYGTHLSLAMNLSIERAWPGQFLARDENSQINNIQKCAELPESNVVHVRAAF